MLVNPNRTETTEVTVYPEADFTKYPEKIQNRMDQDELAKYNKDHLHNLSLVIGIILRFNSLRIEA